jgi:hypothetical protein
MKWIACTESEFQTINAAIERGLGIPDGRTLRYAERCYKSDGSISIPIKPHAERFVPAEFTLRMTSMDDMRTAGWFPPKQFPGDTRSDSGPGVVTGGSVAPMRLAMNSDTRPAMETPVEKINWYWMAGATAVAAAIAGTAYYLGAF